MSQGQKTYSIIISVAVFIIMEVAALAMLRSSSALQNIWINRASHRVMASLWGGGERLRTYMLLDRQNAALAEENSRLQEQVRSYRRREESAREAEKGISDTSRRYLYIPATIIKMSRNSSHNYIIINKGSEDGIKPRSGIITDKGVVGIIDAVGRRYSYGLTLMNTNVSVGVRLSGSNVIAPLVWDGIRSNGAVVDDIPPHYKISPGDTVKTSGYSLIFPPDIPIGVTGRTRLSDGSTLQADVKLFQDFSSLHYVTVVEFLDRYEINSLETSEGGEGR